MFKLVTTFGAGSLLAFSAMAQESVGDAAAGEDVFRQCQTCHVVVDDEGNTLAGRNARTGPNLYGAIGGPAAHDADFNYSDGLTAAAEAGLEWTPENVIAYLQDPTGFLREYLGDSGVRGKMTYRIRSEEDAANVYAYLAQFGGEEAAATN
ncbi:c-type cytochrome [Roseitranquillus sediminis]|uniref:c-type cytochrome n=1 Tax=Roseitranquillus sediminis TaxID=2809051 RepID=UPI001D0CAB47|nr:c-type cytochrome [Roseitranquillus sediminis]MBM9593455.1 c-type cytochrome [Roseitranquillus sediminis]